MQLASHEVTVTPATSNIRKKVLVAVLVVGLSCLPFLLLLQPAHSKVSLHFLKAENLVGSMVASFSISNPPPHLDGLIPLRLERFQANQWRQIANGVSGFSIPGSQTRPFILTCTVFRVSGRLRVVVQRQDRLTKLQSFVFRLGLRLRGDRSLPLSPFYKTVIIRPDPVEVVSDEFEEP